MEDQNLKESEPKFTPKPTSLVLTRQYETYQAALEVHPRNGLSVDACFQKVVLYLIQWLKKRIAIGAQVDMKEINDDLNGALMSIVEQYGLPEIEQLTKYPEPDQMGAGQFSFADMSISGPLDLQVLSENDTHGWVMKLTEPDNGAVDGAVSGRLFITDTAVYRLERTVSLSVRISCKTPEAEDPSAIRPAFIRSMIMDPQLVLTEENMDPKRYAFTREPIHVQISKGAKTDGFIKFFLGNENRQKPVILCSENCYTGDATKACRAYQVSHVGETIEDSEFAAMLHATAMKDAVTEDVSFTKETIDGVAGATAAYGYVVVLEGDAQNLFHFKENCFDETNGVWLTLGNPLLYMGSDPQTDPAWMIERVLSLNEDIADSEKFSKAMNQARDRVKNSSIRASYNFFGHAFYDEVIEKRLQNGAQSAQTFALLKKSNHELQEQTDGYRREIADLTKKQEELANKKERLITSNIEKDRKIASQEKKLEEEKEKARILKEKLDALQKENEQIKRSRRVEASVLNPLLDVAYSYLADKEHLLQWIREKLSDTLVVHPKAEDRFLKYKRPVNMEILCKMIFLLLQYTEIRNANIGKSMPDEKVIEQIKQCNIGYDNIALEPVGNISGLKKDVQEQYQMDISRYNSQKGEITMQMHLKYHTEPELLIRVYYYYDPDIKKSIIGAMPMHLDDKNTANI